MLVDPKRVAKGMYWDRALSLIMGCSPMSEACANCWAARESAMRANNPNIKIRMRHAGLTTDGHFNGAIRYNYDPLEAFMRARKPLVWSVWNDLFHVKVEPEVINHCLDIFATCRSHTVIILTKRIKRAYKLIHSRKVRPIPDNVVLGTTVELPEYIDRIDALLGIPAKCHMVSLEPILEAVDLSRYLDPYRSCDSHTKNAILHGLLNEHQVDSLRMPVLGWVIIGGENAPLGKARPFGFAAFYDTVEQCADTGTPCFVKQTGTALARNRGFRDRIGRDMSEWPERIRVRQFPERR